MDPMAVDPQPQSVINFGPAEEDTGREPARRALFAGLLKDRRVPLLTAALGGVATFGSLVSEWQTTTIDGLALGAENLSEQRVMLTTLIDLGGLGAGYLTGVLLLAVAVVLALIGPASGRPYARLTGLTVGGVLLALVLSLVPHLSETSVLIPQYYTMEQDPLRVAHGRGLWCALAAVAAALLALWRAPDTLRPPARTGDPVDGPPDDDPLDLSITPTTPFASVPGELDQPHRS